MTETHESNLELPTLLGNLASFSGSREEALRCFKARLKGLRGFHSLRIIKESKFGPFPFETPLANLDRILALDATASPSIGKADWLNIVHVMAATIIRITKEENNRSVQTNCMVEILSEIEMLKQSEGFLREVVNANPNLILVKDEDHRITLANQALANFYGSSPSEMIGRTDLDFNVTAEEYQKFCEDDNQVLQTGKTIQIPTEKITAKNGEVHWLTTIKKPLQTNGVISHVLIVASDITEQIHTLEALEVTQLQAQQASLAKTEFLTRMSHELRTPLNVILGFNQLLQRDDNLSETQQETLEIVDKSGKHLLNLINEVLEMTKIEMGDLKLNPCTVDLPNLIAEVISLFEARANANDCMLSGYVSEGLPRFIEADEVKLRQIINNLLSNAVKFTQDGEVALRVSQVSRDGQPIIRIDVRDSGMGIAPEEAGVVFDPFRQTHSGQISEEGAGLGLSLCQQLVHLMGGEIDFTSEVDIGSSFYFEIPLVVAEIQQAQPVAAETEQHSGVGYKVLIADDAPANRLFVSRLLDRLGYEILEAENGLEAVDSHLCNHPDLILMDVKMPEMDGMTATSTIRINEELHHLKRVPIIALTANAFEEHRRKAFAVGCDDFIAKPFDFDHLIQAIANQIPSQSVN